jgi:hypothetical protein
MSEMNENDQELLNTFMKKKSKGEEPPVDKKAEEEVARWDKKKQGTCPRCGNTVKYCSCPEDDYYSTINAYRIPDSKKIKVEKIEIKNFSSFISESLNENAIDILAKDLDSEVYKAKSNNNTVQARSTTKTWDDGVPVLKYIARAKEETVKLPKEFDVVDDAKYGWWYFKANGKWYGIKKEKYGTPPFEY